MAKAKDCMCSSRIRVTKLRIHYVWHRRENYFRNVATIRRNCQASIVHANRVAHHVRPSTIRPCWPMTVSVVRFIMACATVPLSITRACARIDCRIGRRRNHGIWTAIMGTVTRHLCQSTMTVSTFRTISQGKLSIDQLPMHSFDDFR